MLCLSLRDHEVLLALDLDAGTSASTSVFRCKWESHAFRTHQYLVPSSSKRTVTEFFRLPGVPMMTPAYIFSGDSWNTGPGQAIFFPFSAAGLSGFATLTRLLLGVFDIIKPARVDSE